MTSYLAQKQAIKKYQQKNREKLLEYRRQYRLKNLENIMLHISSCLDEFRDK